MDLKTHIGLKVKSARQQKGLTQEELAETIGKATETVSNIERGHALTGLDTLQRIAGVVGVPMIYFFEDIEDGRNVGRRRLEAEEQLRILARKLTDDEVLTALVLLSSYVEHRKM